METAKDTFETDTHSPYDHAFVAKVLAVEKEKNEEKKGLRVDVENLWK